MNCLQGSEPAINTLYLPFPVVAVTAKDNLLLVATKNRTITCIDIHVRYTSVYSSRTYTFLMIYKPCYNIYNSLMTFSNFSRIRIRWNYHIKGMFYWFYVLLFYFSAKIWTFISQNLAFFAANLGPDIFFTVHSVNYKFSGILWLALCQFLRYPVICSVLDCLMSIIFNCK